LDKHQPKVTDFQRASVVQPLYPRMRFEALIFGFTRVGFPVSRKSVDIH